MAILIVFYSRTGRTRVLAQELATHLQADQEELRERADRSGPAGFMAGGRDAMLKRPGVLLPTQRQPDAYDLVILATPVWAFTMTPAVRAWLTREAPHLRRVAFVCTHGGGGANRALADLEQLAGRAPVAKLVARDKDIDARACMPAIAAFAAALATPDAR